jgi:stage V sporulation protein AC
VARSRGPSTIEQQAQLVASYQKAAATARPKPKLVTSAAKAFLVGGLICLVGQVVLKYIRGVEGSKEEVVAVTQAAMVLLGALATDLGVYDDLGEYGGMGAAVPISGFSNTIVSAAIEFRREGWLAGVGSKAFVVAGPVLVYGIVSGVMVGLLRIAWASLTHTHL